MNKIAERTVMLDKGRADVYTENGVTLYAYQTCDLIDNEVFVLAKNGRGVVIELPCFYDNIHELTDFLKQEGITAEAKFVAYHAAGASFLPEVPAYGTASSVAYNTTGGGAGLVANFKNAFGNSFDASLCGVDHVLEEGEIVLAGIRFVEDACWHRAAERYESFLRTRAGQRMLFLELGVGYNTPGIIKYPFWRMTARNPKATYACINLGKVGAPPEIEDRSILLSEDIGAALQALREA